MNFVDKFDGLLPNTDAYARGGSVHVDSVATHAPPGAITVDDGQLLFTGDFKRTGLDLVISKDDRELVLHDYFKGENRAALASPEGAHLTGDLVNALTGYTQYAQAGGAAEPAKVIGHVTKLTGSATAIRNGVAVVLNQGDNVNKGDVVQSGGDSTLGITFIDGTVFGLGPNAKMVLNEMIYDPNGSSNSSLMSLVSGTISFVAGATAKHGDMKVDTPVATMGIRGTAVLVEIDFDVQGTGGVPPAKFQVLVEPDGTTGSYILFDKTTLNPIATVDQAGTQTIVNGQGSVSFVSSAQLSTDAQKLISDVFALKFTDNSNPNTKLTTNFTDSVIPVTIGFKLAGGDIVVPTTMLLSISGITIPQAVAAGSQHVAGPPKVLTQNAEFTEQPGVTHSGVPDTVTGGISWVDVNLGDTPTATAYFSAFGYHDASGNDVASSLTAAQLAAVKAVEIPLLLDSNPLNSNFGSARWTYSLADGAFDFLAAGETLTLTYTVRVDNNFALSNETGYNTITITINGTNDTPVVTSSAQVGSIVEQPWTTNSAVPDTAHGTVTFTDVDLTDTHSVTITGVTEAGVTTGLASEATVLSWLSLGALVDSTDGMTGSRSWTFSAADRYFDYLAVGETLTLTYTVQIDDHHGGVVTLPVTITIAGTDDKPVITSPTQAAAITEIPDMTGSLTHDVASGKVTFTDADLSDTHAVTIIGVAEAGATTGLTEDESTILNWLSLGTLTDATGGVTGASTWTFSAADKNFDYLAAGETLTLTYTIQIDDHHGGVVTQPITITIDGSNDAPTLANVLAGTLVDTAANDTFSPLTGTLHGNDVDHGETATLTYAALNSSHLAVNTPIAGLYGSLTVHADGTYTYVPDSAAINALGEGTFADTFNVETIDAHGAVGVATLTVDVIGANDAPIIHPDNIGLVQNPDGTETITGLTVTDADAAASEIFTLAASTPPGSGNSVTPTTLLGHLSDINTALGSTGLTFNDPGHTPLVTDQIALTVTDGHGASDTLNLIFNLTTSGPNIALQGTAGNDVIFATSHANTLTGGGGADQFVFRADTGNDTITDFKPGVDKINLFDYSPFVAGDADSFNAWLNNAAVEQLASGTLIHLDANDSIMLTNVNRSNLHINDFILHPGGIA